MVFKAPKDFMQWTICPYIGKTDTPQYISPTLPVATNNGIKSERTSVCAALYVVSPALMIVAHCYHRREAMGARAWEEVQTDGRAIKLSIRTVFCKISKLEGKKKHKKALLRYLIHLFIHHRKINQLQTNHMQIITVKSLATERLSKQFSC